MNRRSDNRTYSNNEIGSGSISETSGARREIPTVIYVVSGSGHKYDKTLNNFPMIFLLHADKRAIRHI
jgi:hypothetical protein